MNDTAPITLALPKGRLLDTIQALLKGKGVDIEAEGRELIARDKEGLLEVFLVKNSDLPTYVHYGIAGLGICGSDVIYESGHDFVKLNTYSFGKTDICLAGRKDENMADGKKELKVSTKYPRFTRDYFHSRGIPVEIIKLNGSVELGPVLGLTPFIVDLVETGSTLRANGLEIIEKLAGTQVHLIANPAFYKINYHKVDKIVKILCEDD